MVCFYHFVCTTTGYVKDATVLSVFHFGQEGVRMFFVISGVVISLSMINGSYTYKSFGNFFLKRLARLEPPYLISIVLSLLYLFARKYFTSVDSMPTSKDILLHLGYLIPFVDGAKWANPVYWTLAVEFQYYFILALLIPLALQKKMVYRIVFYLVFLLLPFVYDRKEFFTGNAPLFLLGIVYTFYITEKVSLVEFGIVTSITLIVTGYQMSMANCVTGFVSIALIYFFSDYSNKPFRFLGDISYSLYLLHPITGAAVINFLSHKLSLSYQKPLLIIGGYSLSVICAYLFYKAIEKPSQRLSKNIKYRGWNRKKFSSLRFK